MSDYAGEVSVVDAAAALASDPAAVLLDVRTQAEWSYVGVPDLTGWGKQVHLVEWMSYPSGQPNPAFVDQATADLAADAPVYLLCRSGARSLAAARVLTSLGYTAYNVTEGFEGDLDANGHRTGGWRGAGLPWRQG